MSLELSSRFIVTITRQITKPRTWKWNTKDDSRRTCPANTNTRTTFLCYKLHQRHSTISQLMIYRNSTWRTCWKTWSRRWQWDRSMAWSHWRGYSRPSTKKVTRIWTWTTSGGASWTSASKSARTRRPRSSIASPKTAATPSTSNYSSTNSR